MSQPLASFSKPLVHRISHVTGWQVAASDFLSDFPAHAHASSATTVRQRTNFFMGGTYDRSSDPIWVERRCSIYPTTWFLDDPSDRKSLALGSAVRNLLLGPGSPGG